MSDLQLDDLSGGRFRGRTHEHWTALQGVHGGVVAALALAAVERQLASDGVDDSVSLRAATIGYVSGTVVGDLDIEVDVVRRGRSLVTTHASTTQDGKTTTVARFHHSTPWDGVEFSDAMPSPPMPPDAERLDRERPAHVNNVETYLHPSTQLFGGAERAEWLAWSRPLDGAIVDSAWLLMYGDYFPPAVFTRTTGPSRAVTIEYSLQVHVAGREWDLGTDGLLAARMHAFHSHDGFAVEDGTVHLPDGRLLATTRQTRLAG
ncbi:MAG: thioesterase family protein [Ilumatobacteraceae bacterium]